MPSVQELEISYDKLKEAIVKAKKDCFDDNLRDRDPAVRFDSSVRGHLGELGFKNWLQSHGFTIEDSNFMMQGPNMDIDLGGFNKYHRYFRFEVKTSLIPDVVKQHVHCQPGKTPLDIVEELYDIKIIKRYDEDSPEQIGNDIFVQIYFNQYTKDRDSFTKNLQLSNKKIEAMSTSELIDVFKYSYLKQVFFAWIDKDSLCKYLNDIPQADRFFSFGKRQFWSCPLKISKNPSDLPRFLDKTK